MGYPLRDRLRRLINTLRGRPRRTTWGEDTALWGEHDWDWYEHKRLRNRDETTLYVDDAELEIGNKTMDAWLSVFRTLLVFLLAKMSSAGIISAADSGVLVAAIVNAVPYIAAVAVAVWGAWQHTRAAKITNASALSGVAVVVGPAEKKLIHPEQPGVVSTNATTSPAVILAMDTTTK